jgi:hypothetical protein
MISVHWTGNGHDMTIPFHDWFIVVRVADNDKCQDDIMIYDASGVDVTDDYLVFKSTAFINPTGANLFQVMDILRTNLEKRRGTDG